MIAENQIGRSSRTRAVRVAKEKYLQYLAIRSIVSDLETHGIVNLMQYKPIDKIYLHRIRASLPPHTIFGSLNQVISID